MNQKKQHRRNDPVKILTGISYILLILAGSMGVVLLLGSEMLANRFLPQIVSKQTDKQYTLSFTNLDINYFERSISVEQLVFQHDSATQAQNSKQTVYFETPQLKISKIRLWPLLLDRRLMARSLSIEKPDLKLGSNEKVDMKFLSSKQIAPGDTLELPFFAELFFDTLSILDARVDLDTLLGNKQTLQQVNVIANHFKLGGIKFTDSPFPFDVSDLLLTLDQFKNVLPDSIHQVHIGQIRLSLLHHNIKALKVKLEPISDTLKTNKVIYQLEVPDIQLISDHIDKMHILDTIRVKQLTFNNPDIRIRFGSLENKGTPLNEINFYELTGQRIQWIRMDQFNIKNASIALSPADDSLATQQFKQVNLFFEDLLIDSTSSTNEQRILSAANLQLDVGQYRLLHNDKVHQLIIDSLKIDTRLQKVSTGSVAFVPVQQQNRSNTTLISVNSNRVICEKVNFLEMYHHRKLPMQRLFINEPRIQVNFVQKQNIRKKRNNSSLILDKISDYLTGVYVDETEINAGKIRLNYLDSNRKEGFFKSDFDINLVNLSVDSSTFEQSDKLFFAEHFDVGFNELTLQLADETHQLTSASILLSSSGKQALIKELHIQPREQKTSNDSTLYANKTELFNIRFPYISFEGANLHRAFFDKHLFIANMNIKNPTLDIEKYGEWKTDNPSGTPYQQSLYALIDDYLFSINIRKVSMENGLLNIKQHKIAEPLFELSNQFSINMEQFELDETSHTRPNKLFFSDEIDLVLKNHDFTLADGVHKISTREIGVLSSEKRIYIKQTKIYPDILSASFESMPLTIFAEIPDIQFTQADIFGFFNKGNFPVDQVIVSRPNMKLLMQKTGNRQSEQNDDQKIALLNEFKSFTANRFSIQNGKLELARYENHQSKAILTTQINFTLDQLNTSQDNGRFETSYHDFKVELANVLVNTGDKSHQLKLQGADYQLGNKTLNLKNLQFKPAIEGNSNDRSLEIDMQIPDAQIIGFDIRQLLKQKIVALENVVINNPALSFNDRRIENQQKFSPYKFDLYPYIQPLMNSLSAGEVQLNNAAITLNKPKNNRFSGINLTARNFLIDEQHTRKGKLLNAEQVKLYMENISGKTKGDYFAYKINQLQLNDQGDFSINGLQLQPTLSEKEFAKRKIYQADYFKISNMNAAGSGLNMKELLENNNYYMKEISASFEEVSIFRDKNFPLTPNLKTKLPQQALRELKQGLEIQKAQVQIAYFQFSELEPGAEQKSMVFVSDATADLENVTNQKTSLEKRPNMLGTIKGKLMGIGDAEVHLDMNILSFGNEFTCKAICGPMPLNALNPIAEPGLKISIREGMNQRMEVYFEANEDSATGNIRFAYNDLKIGVLSMRDGTIKEDRFISFLVNSIALKTDNPKPGRILIPARFTNQRDKQRSVVGYCWKSIYAGMKATLGIKDKEN